RASRARAGVSACARDAVYFFQADGGIRGLTVTGVQTCALPICPSGPFERRRGAGEIHRARATEGTAVEGEVAGCDLHFAARPDRSEERRVGKECSSRWRQYTREESDRYGPGVRGRSMLRETVGG